MKIARAISEALKPKGKRVLVPTMGALHDAHRELMRVAREHAGDAGEVAVSIFVNPLQFEPGSDFERYPRPQQEDEDFCRRAGVDLPARASRVTDAAMRRQVIEHLSAWWYRGQAAADELIESAPMVEVIFSGGEFGPRTRVRYLASSSL